MINNQKKAVNVGIALTVLISLMSITSAFAFSADTKDKKPQQNTAKLYEEDYLNLLLMVHKSVKLPLDDYNFLMEMVRRAEEQRLKELEELKKIEAMSSEDKYSLTGGRLECVISGDRATISGSLGIDLHGKGWKEIPLYPLPGLESLTLGNSETMITTNSPNEIRQQSIAGNQEDKIYQINTDDAGKKEIKFVFHPRIDRMNEGNRIYNTLRLEFNQKTAFDIRITLPKGAVPSPNLSEKMKISRDGDKVSISASTDFAEPLLIAWYIPRMKDMQELKPEFNGNLLSFFHFEKGRIRLVSLVNLEILTRAPEKIGITLPGGFNYNDSEKSPGISVTPEGTGKLAIRIDGSVEGLAQFIFFADAPLSTEKVNLLPPYVSGAARQSGWIAADADGFSLKCVEYGDLVPSDSRLIPSEMRNMADAAPDFAFKYNLSETGLKPAILNLTQIKTADSLSAYVKELDFTSVYSQEGLMFTETKASLINNNTQFVKVNLPSSSELQTAFVDNKPVKPVKSPEGDLMIPIKPKESSQDGRVDVLFVFKTTISPMAEDGKLKIELPSVDIPVNLIRLRLFLPDGYEYDSFEGSMLPGDGTSGKTTSTTETGSDKSYSGRTQPGAVRRKTDTRGSTMAGALSVSVNIPKTGSRYDFHDLLVMNEKPVVTFEYEKE